MGRKKLTTAQTVTRTTGKVGKKKSGKMDPATAKTKATATATKEPIVCWCGCGGVKSGKNSHKGRYLPGHDSRAHSMAKRLARQEAGYDEDKIMATLPNNDAKAEFAKHLKVERAKIAAAAKK